MEQMTSRDLEEMAEAFLRVYDKTFKSKKRKKILEYSYHSDRQMRRINGREIPVSALSRRQRGACPNLSGELMYDGGERC